jgi:hypothetical protein
MRARSSCSTPAAGRHAWRRVPPLALLGAALVGAHGCQPLQTRRPDPQPPAPTAFHIHVPASTIDGMAALGVELPVKGRLYVVVDRVPDPAAPGQAAAERPEPRRLVRVTGVPFWGMDVRGVEPGSRFTLAPGADGVRGFPLADVSELPPGEYRVQAVLGAWNTYHRADGHVLELPREAGAGQNPWISPGNAHSDVHVVRLGPGGESEVSLSLDRVIPPVQPLRPGEVLELGNPRDREQVRYVKIRSDLLSEFWGRDMYLGANVLLPRGYDQDTHLRYPTLFHLGHFPGDRAPFGFEPGAAGEGRTAGFADFWMSPRTPGMFVVTIRDANPYFGTSYSVNSANVGPYGDAITRELIPYLEETFRMVGQPWARVLAGGSTGGWEALALQVFHPRYFGGAWSWCPDAVDFHAFQIVNIYEDANAYELDHGWIQVERPSNRRADGNVQFTMRQEGHFELAVADRSRSGGQWAIWEAVHGPVGEDGYPRPIWDPVTGEIDRTTAEYWRRHFDLHHHLRQDWSRLGPELRGKLHIATGDMDSYYLELAVYRLEEFLDTATDPPADARIEYGRRQPHCWLGESPHRPGEEINYVEFVREVSAYLADRAPAGAPMGWLRR